MTDFEVLVTALEVLRGNHTLRASADQALWDGACARLEDLLEELEDPRTDCGCGYRFKQDEDWTNPCPKCGLKSGVSPAVAALVMPASTLTSPGQWPEPRPVARNCFSCDNSPEWKGPGTSAGCSALTLDEETDGPILDYCNAAGVNDKPSPGWPDPKSPEQCPGWVSR